MKCKSKHIITTINTINNHEGEHYIKMIDIKQCKTENMHTF